MAGKNIVILLVCSMIFQVVFSHPSKRDVNKGEICVNSKPCGWAVYNKFSRHVDYFMKNTCICGTDMDCIRTEDDISINAYVYNCKAKPL